MALTIDRRQHFDAPRIQPQLAGRNLDTSAHARTQLSQLVLRHAGHDAQFPRLEQGQQRPPRRGHLPRLGQTAGNDSGKRRHDGGVAAARPRLCGLCRRTLVISLGFVECGLADKFLAIQILGTHQRRFGDFQPRPRRHQRLGRLPRIDTRQHFTGLDPPAGIHTHLDDAPGRLRRQCRLTHRLDHRLGRITLRHLAPLQHLARQRRSGNNRCRRTSRCRCRLPQHRLYRQHQDQHPGHNPLQPRHLSNKVPVHVY